MQRQPSLGAEPGWGCSHYSSSTLEVAQISESSQSTTYLPRVYVCWGWGGSGCLAVWLHKMEAAGLRAVMGYEGQRVLVPKATSEQSKGSDVGACTGSMSETSWTLLCSQQELRSLEHCFSPPSNWGKSPTEDRGGLKRKKPARAQPSGLLL